MRVQVHVREKTILVQCGDGLQKISWLASVGFARYDHNNGLELGQPVSTQITHERFSCLCRLLSQAQAPSLTVYLWCKQVLVKLEDGTEVPMDAVLKEALPDELEGCHVWVLSKDDA